MTLEVRSFRIHQDGAGPGRLLAERPFELVVLLGRARPARAAAAAGDDADGPDDVLYDASVDAPDGEDQDGWGDRDGAPARVRLTLEAFGGEDPASAPRVQLLRVTVSHLGRRRGTDGHHRVRWGLPAGLERVRLRLTAQVDGRDGDRAEALLPASGTLRVEPAGDGAPAGEVDEAPSIHEVLQRRTPSASSGEGAAGVVDHVAAQLRDLPAFLERALGEPPYAPLEGEVGPDGRPATGLASWQRQLLELMTGAFYAYSPRRVIQNLHHGVGRPLTAVCNNNVDIAAWLRGAEVPNWEAGGGVGFGCNGRTVDALARTIGVDPQTAQPDAPPAGAFIHDFRAADAATSGAVDEEFRDWSFRQARPGSIFLYADPTNARQRAHINVALRVRRRGDAVEVQLFDTGAVEATSAVAPRALGEYGKALGEGGWRPDLHRTFGDGDSKKCIAHAWFPPADAERALPAWPLWRASSATDAPEGGAVATTLALAYRGPGHPDYPAEVGAPTWIATESRSVCLRLLPDELYPSDLRAGATRPLLHLAITRRADGAPVYLSRPLRCSRAITHLLGSVAGVPAAAELEARWLLLVIGAWTEYLEQGFDPPEPPPRGPEPPLFVALQVACDEVGVARLIRPQKVIDDPAFTDRLQPLWDAGLSRFYDAAGGLLPASGWPAEPWRDAALDDRLAAQVESPAPAGLDDAIPTGAP